MTNCGGIFIEAPNGLIGILGATDGDFGVRQIFANANRLNGDQY